jgi:hypothetical protein
MSRSEEENRWAEIKRKEDAVRQIEEDIKNHQKFLNSLNFTESKLYSIEKEITSVNLQLAVLGSSQTSNELLVIKSTLSQIDNEIRRVINKQEEAINFYEKTYDLLKKILIALIILIFVVLIKN